jgi:two-component system OmpR family response regulator
VSEKRVYIVTGKGNAELTGASTTLSPTELKLLVLVDGIATVADIARNTRNQLEVPAVAAMLEKLAKAGYIADPDGTGAINIGDFFKESESGMESLQANGFFVRIARRAPNRAPSAAAQKLTVLAVEDDPALSKLLRMYLQMEEFNVRLAATRAEINTALREPPKPDVVLLDVVLPDGDGFEILRKMRAHPFLKDVPIIMATAKATREAVLNGLRSGADGYVTKPFDMEIVLKAIKSVLGIAK